MKERPEQLTVGFFFGIDHLLALQEHACSANYMATVGVHMVITIQKADEEHKTKR
jgi:hypothetical protein